MANDDLSPGATPPVDHSLLSYVQNPTPPAGIGQPQAGFVSVAPRADVSNLSADFAQRAAALQRAAKAAGIDTTITSGYRSNSEQAQLYARYKSGQGGIAAPPGQSYHNSGNAVDMYASDPTKQSWLIANAPKFGIYPGANFGDPGHFQMAGANPGADHVAAAAPVPAPSASFLNDFPATPANPASAAAGFLLDFPATPQQPNKANATSAAAPVAPPVVAPAQPPSVLSEFPAASHGVLGANGLIWDAVGGHDPQTGALVIAGRPFSGQPTSPAVAATSGLLSGIPIAGPALARGAAQVAGAINALHGGINQPEAYQAVQQSSQGAYPKTALAGNIAGSVGGMGAMIAAAPAAFGIGSDWIAGTLLSGASGAAVNAADTAARGGDSNAIKNSAITGGAIGLAAPVAGNAVGSAVNRIGEMIGNSPKAAELVANGLHGAGMTPADASAALARLGPTGTLADVDPALAWKAGALAASGGEPTSVMMNFFKSRAATADNRIAGAVSQYLGSRPDLTTSAESIAQDASASAKPYYDAMRANPSTLDISPVLSTIDSNLSKATGGVASTLNTVKNYLVNKVQTPVGQMVVPKSDAESLLGARQAIDDLIQRGGDASTTAGKNALRQAGMVRGQLDSILKTDPNIAAGDAAFSSKMGQLDALNEGTDLFKAGTRIEDVQRSIAGKSPEEIAAMRTGALSAFHDAMDGTRGDFSVARQMLAKGTANRAKLDAMFPQSGPLLDTLSGEIAKRETENIVAQGSKTAGITAAREEFAMKPPAGQGSVVPALTGYVLGGAPGAEAGSIAGAIGGRVKNALMENAMNRLKVSAARGLSATGQEQTDFMRQVGNAYNWSPRVNALANAANVGTNLLTRPAGNALVDYVNQSR